jgi:hypothetical protein
MRTVRTHVDQSTLGDVMRAMRLWLDKNGSPDVRFEITDDKTGILISVEFKDECVAHAFEHEFARTIP